jgi:hypothetical protein
MFVVYDILARWTWLDEAMLAVRWEKKRLTFERWKWYNKAYKKEKK